MPVTTLATLNTISRTAFVSTLGGIFEHSAWVAEGVAGQRPFARLADLHSAMMSTVRSSHREKTLQLLRSHPDLAGKAAQAGEMSPDSTREQDGAGLDRLAPEALEQLQRLNAAYSARFGFPFILCVRRHTRDSIFTQFEMRLANDPEQEFTHALGEISRITALRLDQHVAAPDKLRVHGFLDVHVIDTTRGLPAWGLAVELHELRGDGTTWKRGQCVIDDRGLPEMPLLADCPIPLGQYEVRFLAGAYFAERRSLFDIIPVRFAVAEPEGKYHIPLRLTPWSYTVYRGQ